MTNIKLFGGSLGNEHMFVQCDLSQAKSPVRMDYFGDGDWENTQYQCADAGHTYNGLLAIAYILAAQALEIPLSQFSCKNTEIEYNQRAVKRKNTRR
jgi:hypothetical protein